MSATEFDLIVIGSGPAGQKAAINAAKLRKRVAIIDRNTMMGGVSVHKGTIPSKSVREAILHLTGFTERTFYGPAYRVKEDISLEDLASRVHAIVNRESEVVRDQLRRNGVSIFGGIARLIDPHTVEVTDGSPNVLLTARFILIACGTRPARIPNMPFDGSRVIDTDQFAGLKRVPRETIVVGGGVVGLGCASFLAALGGKVTLIDQRPALLEFVDDELVEALMYHLRRIGVTFRLGEKVSSVGLRNDTDQVFAQLESGKQVRGDALIYAVGRQANGDEVGLEAAGLKADARGKVTVNEFFQTPVPHIYAAGDVIGFPALASTAMEQGRRASCHMFGVQAAQLSENFPYGIYTIPEISMVGKTEEQLTASKTPYEVGVARYSELAKSMMLGDENGMLKLLFDPKSLGLLGVHAIGERATEIIHIGQAVMSLGGTVEYFRDAVFNYPTLAEAYKVAALDGLNKLT
jgi:NAD(P) transhydrogenase